MASEVQRLPGHVQEAVKVLVDDGLIEARALGAFVAERKPGDGQAGNS